MKLFVNTFNCNDYNLNDKYFTTYVIRSVLTVVMNPMSLCVLVEIIVQVMYVTCYKRGVVKMLI